MIAVDAMGGDHAPRAIVEGAVAAARCGIPVLLIGQEQAITSHLPADWAELPIVLEFCTDQVLMTDDPGRAIRTKSDSSMVRGMKLVAQEKAHAFFSAGNSGAVMVGGVLIIGRLAGIHRPAVGTFLPTRKGSLFCLDVGANVDCKAPYLYQFALMGHAYLEVTKNITQPRIGLLSNGHEPYKGPTEVKKAYEILSYSALNFIGNIEARELGNDVVDVVVCDGFAGNILLKAIQGTARTLFGWIKDETERSWVQRGLFWLNSRVFKAIRSRMDYTSVGGALLLGVKHPVIVAHGSSDARAIENGIKFAYRMVKEQHVATFNKKLNSLLDDKSIFTGAARERVQTLLQLDSQ